MKSETDRVLREKRSLCDGNCGTGTKKEKRDNGMRGEIVEQEDNGAEKRSVKREREMVMIKRSERGRE